MTIAALLLLALLQAPIVSPSPAPSPTPEEKDDGDAATIFTVDGTEIAWDRASDRAGTFKVKKAGKGAEALGWKKGDEIAGDGKGPWLEDVHEALRALKAMGTGPVKRDQGSVDLPYFFASDDQIESSPHGLRPMRKASQVLAMGEGGRFDLVKKAAGRPLLLNFWASWCGPCEMEMPVMERLSKAYAGRVWFVGLNVDETRGEVLKFLEKHPVSYPIVMVGNMVSDTSRAYSLEGIPLTVIITADGRVALVGTGYRGERHERWIADALDTLLKPGVTPTYLIHKPGR
jgi:thiol-disulfide isomerase/thioredoxin